jgi:hypothetical protein
MHVRTEVVRQCAPSVEGTNASNRREGTNAIADANHLSLTPPLNHEDPKWFHGELGHLESRPLYDVSDPRLGVKMRLT